MSFVFRLAENLQFQAVNVKALKYSSCQNREWIKESYHVIINLYTTNQTIYLSVLVSNTRADRTGLPFFHQWKKSLASVQDSSNHFLPHRLTCIAHTHCECLRWPELLRRQSRTKQINGFTQLYCTVDHCFYSNELHVLLLLLLKSLNLIEIHLWHAHWWLQKCRTQEFIVRGKLK